MNNSVNATTGKTPTELLYGCPIRLFPAPVAKDDITIPATADYIAKIKDSIVSARDRHAEAKTRQVTQANKHKREEPEYRVGDCVYMDTEHLHLGIKQKGRSAKFYPRFAGALRSSMPNPRRQHTSFNYCPNTVRRILCFTSND